MIKLILKENSVVCLMGPTGSGKSALAAELIHQYPLEIISVDSAMVYRGLNIGSAKPTQSELKNAPHRLIDIREPDEIYSAADFRRDALKEIEDIRSHGKTPLLVGGTMLYFKALQEGLSDLPSANEAIRNKISSLAAEQGWQKMHDLLSQVDFESAQRIHPNDAQRIQRALEIYEMTGKPMTQLYQENEAEKAEYEFINLAIIPKDRSVLHQRIKERLQKMLADGFVEEVKKLRARGDLSPDLPSMRSVGYRQVWAYLDGEYDYDTMVEKIEAATRQLAKRQLTWLRSWPGDVLEFIH